MCDAILIFPPQWFPGRPYLSVPSLTAFLLNENYTVLQRDLNVECYDKIFSKHQLESYYLKVKAAPDTLEKRGVERSKLRFLNLVGEHILSKVEETKKRMQTAEMVADDFLFINIALQIISLAYYPTSLLLSKYDPPDLPLKEAVTDRRTNPYIELFEELHLTDLLKNDPTLMGVTVSSLSQVVPTLTLSHMMKREHPDLHICLGGNTFSRFSEELRTLEEVFDFVDSIIFFDGETALASLIECLEREQNLSTVPNLVFRDGDRIRKSKVHHWEDMDALPTPVFDGLPLDKYFSPILVLPVQTARGCYWARCAFCAVPYGEGSKYRSRDAALVAEDMAHLHARYKTCSFELTDDAVPPQKLRLLSEELLGSNMKWTAEVRLEKQFTRELLSTMYEAGCRILYFGLESANPRVLQLMEKGTDVKTSQRILSDSHAVGIWNHVYVFFGFPTETEQEAEDTIQFVFKNKDVIDSVGFGHFLLYKNSKVCRNYADYSITEISERSQPFSFILDFETCKGMSGTQIEAVKTRLESLIYKDSKATTYYEWLALIPLLKRGEP